MRKIHKTHTPKRMISWLLALCICFSTVVTCGLFAAAENTTQQQNTTNFTVNMGTPIKEDNEPDKFTYPHANVTAKTGVTDPITVLNVTVTSGTIDTADLTEKPTMTDNSNKSATWIFSTADNKTANDITTMLKKLQFTKGDNMDITVTVDSNKVSENLKNTTNKLTYNPANGHYYMYVSNTISWSKAYNAAKTYTFAGRKGYLATPTDQAQVNYMLSISNTVSWYGGTSLLYNNAKINDLDKLDLGNNKFQYQGSHTMGQTAQNKAKMYWACGPKAGTPLSTGTTATWGNGEPNEVNATDAIDKTNGNVQSYETCLMLIIESGVVKGINDILEGNRPQDNLKAVGYFVEFGGYVEAGKADPGGRDETKTGKSEEKNVTPMEAEANINGLKYAPLSEACKALKDGETLVLEKATGLTKAEDQILPANAKIQTKDGHTYTAGNGSTPKIDIDENGQLTLKDGVIDASANAPVIVPGTDGKNYTVIASEAATVTASGNNEPTVRSDKDGTVKIGDVTYTYQNPSDTESAVIAVPDAMKNSDEVTKAEIPANIAATVVIDDTQNVTTDGNGTGKVTVEKVNNTPTVKFENGANATAFGSTVSNAGPGELTLTPPSAGATIPDRAKVTATENGTFTADGHTYTVTDDMKEFYLGEFDIKLTVDEHLTADPTTVTRTVTEGKKYYGDVYEVTLKPMENYEISPDDVTVEMNNQALAETVATQDGENVKVQVTVKGNAAVTANAKRQMRVITVTDATNTQGNVTASYVDDNSQTQTVDKDAQNQMTVEKGREVTLKFDNPTFFVWKKDDNTLFTEKTNVTDNMNVTPTFKSNVETGTDGAKIGADNFPVHLSKVAAFTEDKAKTDSAVQAVQADGTEIAKDQITVDLSALKNMTEAGVTQVTFTANGVSVTVEVEVLDTKPIVTGKTAHTITFVGEPNTEYTVKKPDGSTETIITDANGKATVKGLQKGQEYTISNEIYGETTVKTSLVDAKDIAESFAKDGDTTTTNGKTDETESAENSNVTVTVDEDGNYKAALKQNVDKTVEVPDTWETVKVDLNGNNIKGDDATQTTPAAPGLKFTQGTKNDRPGTKLNIVDTKGTGKVQGGNGSVENPNGAAGIETDTAKAPTETGVTVGGTATILGGNGATDATGTGGNGGAGITGALETTVSGGHVQGGNGGDGSTGDGGTGAAGIKTDNKQVKIESGTVTGGDGGNGGSSTESNGSNGGNGGTGIDSGSGSITIDKNGTVSGGAGGNGGNSTNQNAGNGGQGGGGTIGETNNSGKIDGGTGGAGGNSEHGNGGNGGQGGSGTDGKTDNNQGGQIGGGTGGNGGFSTDKDGGTGGSGGNGINGETTNSGNVDGGVGGAGGDSDKGNGGNGGAGGNGIAGNTENTESGQIGAGQGGAGGNSNLGSGGRGGQSGVPVVGTLHNSGAITEVAPTGTDGIGVNSMQNAQTGDNTPYIALVSIAVLAAGFMLIALRKKAKK